jgi:hypothetical protein
LRGPGSEADQRPERASMATMTTAPVTPYRALPTADLTQGFTEGGGG